MPMRFYVRAAGSADVLDFNLSAGRPRQAAEFHAFARAIESEDMELCSRMLDTSVAVSRVLETARRDAGIRFTTDL